MGDQKTTKEDRERIRTTAATVGLETLDVRILDDLEATERELREARAVIERSGNKQLQASFQAGYRKVVEERDGYLEANRRLVAELDEARAEVDAAREGGE